MDPLGLALAGIASAYTFLQDYIGGLVFNIVRQALMAYPAVYGGAVVAASIAFPIFAGLLVLGVAAALIINAVDRRAQKAAHAIAIEEGTAVREPVVIVPFNRESLPKNSKYRNAGENTIVFTSKEQMDRKIGEKIAMRIAEKRAASGAPMPADFAREARNGVAPAKQVIRKQPQPFQSTKVGIIGKN